jgi:hypothetical protein
LKCNNFLTTQLLSSGEFCKLRYDTIPVKKVHLQTFVSIPVTRKCQILSRDNVLSQMSDMSFSAARE